MGGKMDKFEIISGANKILHSKGDKNCSEGACNVKDWWFMSGVVPKQCLCGGIVHGNCGYYDMSGDPEENYQCDSCLIVFSFDEVIALKDCK